MNIWEWFHDRQRQLWEQDPSFAQSLGRISNWTVNGHHHKVDAALPELVAKAKQRGDAWLEVYVRHWGLQSRILHRNDARADALKEAVSLIERASRDDARDCPQSICAAQDLCSAYSLLDDEGYTAERVRASEETLARIDPSWPCFSCIQAERIGALIDENRFEEALAAVDTAEAAMRGAGSDDDLHTCRFDALMGLGRAQEALEVAETMPTEAGGESKRLHRLLMLAEAHQALKQHEQAEEHLPPFEALHTEVEHYEQWLDVQGVRIDAGRVEHHHDLMLQAERMLRVLSKHLNHRALIRASLAWAERALDRGAWGLAHWWCERAASHLPHLARPLGAPEAVAALSARIEAARPAPIATDSATLEQRINAPDHDISFSDLVATAPHLPDDADLALLVARLWRDRGVPERSLTVLRACRDHSDDPSDVQGPLCQALLDLPDLEGLEAELATIPETGSPRQTLTRLWYGHHLDLRRGRRPEAIEKLQQLVATDVPMDRPFAIRALASLLQKEGRHREALQALSELLEAEEPERNDAWFAMELATLTRDWDRLRHAAAIADLELDDSEPPRLRGGALMLTLPSGEEVWALRTGPCMARITQIAAPRSPEHFGVTWAFDPFTATQANEEAPMVYTAHEPLDAPNQLGFAVDGVRLDAEQIDALIAYAEDEGGGGYLSSGDAYKIAHEGVEFEASYVRLAMPADADWQGLHEQLLELAKSLEGPLTWVPLCRFVADHAAVAAQTPLAEQWGLDV